MIRPEVQHEVDATLGAIAQLRVSVEFASAEIQKRRRKARASDYCLDFTTVVARYARHTDADTRDLAREFLGLKHCYEMTQRLSDVWPHDLAWPDGIKRPVPFPEVE